MQETPNWITKLMTKWGLRSPFHVIVICIVFAITGTASVQLAQPVLHAIGFYQSNMNNWIYWPLRIVIIFPVYQVVLIVIGTLFGQFRFFWNMEKKMMTRLISPFLKNR